MPVAPGSCIHIGRDTRRCARHRARRHRAFACHGLKATAIRVASGVSHSICVACVEFQNSIWAIVGGSVNGYQAQLMDIDPQSRIRALPIWRGDVTLAPLKGGVSNASFVVEDATGKYVARVGEDYPFHQVSRERERIAARAAFAAGLSPEVVHTEPGIMVLRYLEARTYSEADVRANAGRCVDIVKRCHRDMGKRITGQGAIFWVFQILRDYSAALGKSHWLKIIDALEAAQAPLPIIFGHHDLLPSNFMEDGESLWLIDWEYGAFGTAMFDLANLASNNSFEEKDELSLLENYFECAPTDATSRAFYAMKSASALREGLWGLVSAQHLNAPGVDYAAYAAEYLRRFERIYAQYTERFGR